MPSAAQIRKLAKMAIKQAGDLATKIKYVSVTPGNYVPADDEVASVEVTYNNVPVIVVGLNEEESAWFIPDAITQKLIIAALDLPVKPDRPDYVEINGVRWEVKKVKGVPGELVWRVYIQEP